MAPRPNLSDIAKALGVSVATVSNAMSGKGRVSEEVGERVRRKAEAMGYKPSVAGRALRTGRSGVIGLVLADIAHPLFPQIAQSIENAAAAHGYGVLIGDSRGDVHLQTNAIERLIERGADGIVVVPRHGTRIADIGRPIAVIDSPSTPGNTVSADHWDAGSQIGAHLASLGHSSLLVIGGHADSNVQNDRIGGIRSTFPGQVQLIWVTDIEEKSGIGCELGLKRHVDEGVTAIAATSDLHALRAVTELQRTGIAMPADVSVTGFDDLIWASAIMPALTTMRMDTGAIADIAVADLIRQIESPSDRSGSPRPRYQSIPMHLIVRQSSGSVRKPVLKRGASAPVRSVRSS